MGRSEACLRLHRKRPTSNLISKKVLVSLIGQIVIQALFQFTIYMHVKQQPFYRKPERDGVKNIKNYENTCLFLFSCFQYIFISAVFSVGYPYRKSLFSNGILLFYIIILKLILLIIILYHTHLTYNVSPVCIVYYGCIGVCGVFGCGA